MTETLPSLFQIPGVSKPELSASQAGSNVLIPNAVPAPCYMLAVCKPPSVNQFVNQYALGGMKRVAVFGNAGGGKSTLARELAAITGLPLAVVDELQYRAGGIKVSNEEYLQAHAKLLANDKWIIDGFGGTKLVWERLEAADTLILVDLPLAVHAFWVTKRLIKGLFVTPLGWPEGSPIISSSISSYRVLWPCHTSLTPKYRSYVSESAKRKRVFHLRSSRELILFLESMRKEHARVRQEAAQPPVAAAAPQASRR